MREGSGRDGCRAAGAASASRPSQRVVRAVKEGMATATDKRKQSLYFPEEVLVEIQQEAIRQDRSLSWVVQQAWKLARERMNKIPGVSIPPMVK